MRGRKRKPTALHRAAGNPGKRPLNEREPEPAIVLPPPPAYLDEIEAAEWNELARRLHDCGVLTECDVEALALLCGAWSRYLTAQAKLKEYGLVFSNKKLGTMVLSPYLKVANDALKQIKDIAIEFGMTPSSRSRIISNGGDTSKKNQNTKKSKYFRDR